MALKAGYVGVKADERQKLAGLADIQEVGEGLQLDDGELVATGATMTIDPNPEGDATVSLEKLQIGETIYGVNDNTKCYQTDDGTESAIVDTDYIPFLDSSAASGEGAPKKSTWSNFVSKIQAKLTAFVDWSSYAKTGVHNIAPITLKGIKALNTEYTWDGNAVTINGMTYTVNVDSDENVISISASGTVEQGENALLEIAHFNINDSYILSGCPTGGGNSKYEIAIVNEARDTFISRDYGDNGEQFSYNGSVWMRVVARSEQTLTNAVFYPMIRYATDSNVNYAPFAMTNKELTEIKTGTVSEYINSYASFNTSSAYLVSRAGIKKLYMFVTISTVAASDDWIQIATLSKAPTKAITGINVPWDSALGSARSFVYQIDTDGKVYIRAKAEMSSIISEIFI